MDMYESGKTTERSHSESIDESKYKYKKNSFSDNEFNKLEKNGEIQSYSVQIEEVDEIPSTPTPFIPISQTPNALTHVENKMKSLSLSLNELNLKNDIYVDPQNGFNGTHNGNRNIEVNIYMFIYVYMNMYLYLFMYLHIYTCIRYYIYIHTYTG
jgi:hypothetical protein